jgi:predicted RNA-binding protein YlxR (DUF448 family)
MSDAVLLSESDLSSYREYDRRSSPLRRCIITGVSMEKEKMLRFICDELGVIWPDVAMKMPGRGAWVVADPVLVEAACRRKSFSRVFRRHITSDETTILASILLSLQQHVLSLIGMAKKASLVVVGMHNITSVSFNNIKCVFQAIGAKNTVKGWSGPVYQLFDLEILSAAVGVETAMYMAIKNAPLADRIVTETERLSLFRNAMNKENKEGI